MTIILTKKISIIDEQGPNLILCLTAEERIKAKQKIALKQKNVQLKLNELKLDLPRGTVLQSGDFLTTETEDFWVLIQARSEPVVTVTAQYPLQLAKAAYHLGNRHVSLEITNNYLRFSPDHVIESMLIQMGFNLTQELAPFSPEIGAYKH